MELKIICMFKIRPSVGADTTSLSKGPLIHRFSPTSPCTQAFTCHENSETTAITNKEVITNFLQLPSSAGSPGKPQEAVTNYSGLLSPEIPAVSRDLDLETFCPHSSLSGVREVEDSEDITHTHSLYHTCERLAGGDQSNLSLPRPVSPECRLPAVCPVLPKLKQSFTFTSLP